MKKSVIISILLTLQFITAAPVQAVISNGAPAFDLLGQYDSSVGFPDVIFTKNGYNDSPNNRGYDQPSDTELDAVNHRLFVSDTFNHRVLVYNLTAGNTLIDHVPDFVLGAPDFTTPGGGLPTATSMNRPMGLGYDEMNQRLYVADNNNSRVLVFDVTSITNNEPAQYVIGQPDFTSNTPVAAQDRLFYPGAVEVNAATNRLFIGSNRRVMIYDISSLSNGMAAMSVVGQVDYTSTSSSINQAILYSPSSIVFSQSNSFLYVADRSRNRVLVFVGPGFTPGMNAGYVIGQADMFSADNTVSSTITPDPAGLSLSNNLLYVSQAAPGRISIFDVTLVTSGEPAINVLGQPDLSTNTEWPPDASTLTGPAGLVVHAASNVLYVAEQTGHGVKQFDINSVTNGMNAIDIQGHMNSTDPLNPTINFNSTGDSSSPDIFGLTARDTAIDRVNHRLFVADVTNSRILVYQLNNDNTLVDKIPDNVIGRTSFIQQGVSNDVADNTLWIPSGMAYDSVHDRLFVSDTSRNRILVFDTSSISNGMAASYVFGQGNFTDSAGSYPPTMTSLSYPTGLAYDADNDRLFAADNGNGRVLVYDTSSLANGQAPIHLLGRNNYSDTDFMLPQSTNRFASPNSVAYDPAREYLFVSDTYANRIMVFDVDDITDSENAIFVLGQEDFDANGSGTSIERLSLPQGISYDHTKQRLFVADQSNNRVMVFDLETITNGEDASFVLGQPDFDNNTGSATQSTLSGPYGVRYDANGTLYVSDEYNGRLMMFEALDAAPAIIVEETGGTTDVTEGGTTDTFTVVLDAPATDDVILNINSDDTSSMDVSPASLTFTSENWYIPQIVTVSAVNDPNTVSETPTVTISVDDANSDDIYDAVTDATVSVNVTDNDTAGLTLVESGGDTTIIEGGASDSFTVVLNTQPTTNVIVLVYSNDPAATVDPASLTFTTANWDTPQTVTVEAPLDSNLNSETPIITLSIDDANSDTDYDSIADSTVIVQVTDITVAGYSVTESGGSTAVTEGGITDSFDVVLTAVPFSDVVFDITSNDPSVAVSPTTLTFTPLNWNTPQTVTVTAADDSNYVSENTTITVSVNDAASDNIWDPLADEIINVAVTDNDMPPTSPVTGIYRGGSGGGFVPTISTPRAISTGTIIGEQPPEETGGTEETPTDGTGFEDTTGHWSAPYIAALQEQCSLTGFIQPGNKNVFLPNQEITRAELVKLLMECSSHELLPLTEKPFLDIDPGVWYARYIVTAKEIGWVEGYPDGNFRPNAFITREEAIKLLLLLGYDIDSIEGGRNVFSDVVEGEWYARYTSFAYLKGIISGYLTEQGYHTNRFGVQVPITRGEVMKVIYEVLIHE